MLTVLALIAVLSILGITTFRYAMVKHHANNLIEDVKVAGFVVVADLFPSLSLEQELDMTDKFERTTSFLYSAVGETETTFEILLKGVPYRVCQEIKTRKLDWLEEINANKMKNVCYSETLNTISFFFNTNFTGNTETVSHSCRKDKECPQATPYCCNGDCQKCVCNTIFDRVYGCRSCEITSHATERSECYKCENKYFVSEYKDCRTCGIHSNGRTTLEDCQHCPNRYFDVQSERCAFCPTGTTASTDGLSCI